MRGRARPIAAHDRPLRQLHFADVTSRDHDRPGAGAAASRRPRAERQHAVHGRQPRAQRRPCRAAPRPAAVARRRDHARAAAVRPRRRSRPEPQMPAAGAPATCMRGDAAVGANRHDVDRARAPPHPVTDRHALERRAGRRRRGEQSGRRTTSSSSVLVPEIDEQPRAGHPVESQSPRRPPTASPPTWLRTSGNDDDVRVGVDRAGRRGRPCTDSAPVQAAERTAPVPRLADRDAQPTRASSSGSRRRPR